jgi:hypothetical protein
VVEEFLCGLPVHGHRVVVGVVGEQGVQAGAMLARCSTRPSASVYASGVSLAPLRACIRKVGEELGITPPIGGLLVVDWPPPTPKATSSCPTSSEACDGLPQPA